MRINEVIDTPVDEYMTLHPAIGYMDSDELAGYQHVRDRLKLVDTPISDDFEVRYKKDGAYHQYILFDRETTRAVGVFALEEGSGRWLPKGVVKPGVKVVTPHLTFIKEYQGRGMGSRIYKSFLDQGKFVYVTDAHTPAAQGLWDKLAGMPDMLNFYWDNSYEIAAAFPFTGETKEDAKRLLGRKDLFGNFPVYKNKAEVKAVMKKQDEKDYGAF